MNQYLTEIVEYFPNIRIANKRRFLDTDFSDYTDLAFIRNHNNQRQKKMPLQETKLRKE